MTEPPDDEATVPHPAPPRRSGRLAVPLAALSCLLSALSLAIALAGTTPPMTLAAQAAVPPLRELPRPEAPLAPDAARLLMAIELLLPQLQRPSPFPRAFAVAVALASGDAEAMRLLLPLAAAASEGAPTMRQLAEGFGAAADAAVLAEMGFAPQAGWLARGVAGTMRLGAASGAAWTPGLAALRDATAQIAAGEAAAAEATLATLRGAAAAALAPWRSALGRRLAADAAAAQLAALALARAQDATREAAR